MQLPLRAQKRLLSVLSKYLVIHRLVVYSYRPRWNQAVLRQPAHTTSPDGMCETTGRYCGISRVARRRRRRCLDECSRPLRCDVRRHGVRGQSLSGPTAQATPGWSGQPSPGTKMGLRGGEQFVLAGCGVGALGLGCLAPGSCLLVAAEGLPTVSRRGQFSEYHVVVGSAGAENVPSLRR